jgi:hypothetical protein
MFKKQFLVLILSISVCFIQAQNKFTLSGYVSDSASGERLIAANVFDVQKKFGTITNTYGFFSITLPEGEYTIRFSYVGYHQQTEKISLHSNQELNAKLPVAGLLAETVITAQKAEKIEEKTQMGQINIPMKQIKLLPAFMGEVDILKTLQMLPGVKPGMEGTSGLYVRGGTPDQNLILLDGTPLYNVSHLFGFFSVFNADAIKSVDLIKGGFPARYGGRLSSVLEINMKEGNLKKYKVEGSTGIIASKIMIEGPIVKDKSSFLIAARRTYIDYLINPLMTATGAQSEYTRQGYFFYDLNAKINFKLSKKDHLYISGYKGKDKFYNNTKPYQFLYDGVVYENEQRNELGWGNMLGAIRWNRQFSKKHFSNVTLNYTEYKYNVLAYYRESVQDGSNVEETVFYQNYITGIKDFGAQIGFDYIPDPKHYVKYGGNITRHRFFPGATVYEIKEPDPANGNFDSTIGSNKIPAIESFFYVEDDYKISDKLKLNGGLHFSNFYVGNKWYYSLQPRVSARYLMKNNWALKGSYAFMRQYIHLLTNNSIGLPTDLWVPTTEKILPEYSHQVSAGIAKTLKDMFEFSVEGYYKVMNNILDYKNGASYYNTNESWEDKVEAGKGWSYGAELFLQKKYGKTQGWVAYTLSWTNRQFTGINFGEKYPFKYDSRHTASVTVTHDIDKKWKISAAWVYSSGNAITLANVRYMGLNNNLSSGGYFGTEIESFDKRNGFRTANYHRLDLGAQRTYTYKWGELGFNLGIYNTYSRRNPFYYRFDYDYFGNRVLKRVSLFPIIPSLTLNFKFL